MHSLDEDNAATTVLAKRHIVHIKLPIMMKNNLEWKKGDLDPCCSGWQRRWYNEWKNYCRRAQCVARTQKRQMGENDLLKWGLRGGDKWGITKLVAAAPAEKTLGLENMALTKRDIRVERKDGRSRCKYKHGHKKLVMGHNGVRRLWGHEL